MIPKLLHSFVLQSWLVCPVTTFCLCCFTIMARFSRDYRLFWHVHRVTPLGLELASFPRITGEISDCWHCAAEYPYFSIWNCFPISLYGIAFRKVNIVVHNVREVITNADLRSQKRRTSQDSPGGNDYDGLRNLRDYCRFHVAFPDEQTFFRVEMSRDLCR